MTDVQDACLYGTWLCWQCLQVLGMIITTSLSVCLFELGYILWGNQGNISHWEFIFREKLKFKKGSETPEDVADKENPLSPIVINIISAFKMWLDS